MKHATGLKTRNVKYTLEEYEKLQLDYEDNHQSMMEYLESGGYKKLLWFMDRKIYLNQGTPKHLEFLAKEAELEWLCMQMQRCLGIFAEERRFEEAA